MPSSGETGSWSPFGLPGPFSAQGSLSGLDGRAVQNDRQGSAAAGDPAAPAGRTPPSGPPSAAPSLAGGELLFITERGSTLSLIHEPGRYSFEGIFVVTDDDKKDPLRRLPRR